MQKSAVFLAIMVLLLGVFLMSETRRDPLAKIDDGFADWIAANGSLTGAPARVALVEINDSSLGREHPWPWTPLDFALFVEGALQFKPDVVAIEPTLNWADAKPGADALQKQQQYGKILHDSILKTPKAVLGAQLGHPDDPELAPPLLSTPALHHAPGDLSAIQEYTVIERQSEEDYRLSAATGFTNVPPEGGIVRTAPMVFRYHGQLVPSLALQAVIEWLKLSPDEVTVEPGSRILLGKTLAVPINAAGRMTVNFQLPVARTGYDDLLLAVSQTNDKQPPPTAMGTSRGGILLLARTDKESRNLLFPTERKGSSGELCAAAIATIQNRCFARRASALFDCALIAAAMAFACYAIRLARKKLLTISLLSTVGYLMVAISAYSVSLVLLPIVLPVALLALVNFFNLLQPRGK